jgi:MFS family permease
MLDKQENERLRRRFRPLYWHSFFQSLMLWYAIEKLFMQGIGFNDAQIALAGILISATMVLLQVPTGILADRWSRKGTLFLGNGLLAINALVGVFSHSVLPYLWFASILWGAFASIRSGTYDAIVYDTLLEETGDAQRFEHYFGRVQLYMSAGFVLAALLSGVIGKYFGLRATYWMSLPFIALSVLILLKFKEPIIHKAQVKTSLIKHTTQTLKAVMQTGYIFWIVLASVLFGMISRLLNNLSPVWYLAFALPVIWWGPAYALIHISGGIAGSIVSYMNNSRFKIFAFALFISLMSLVLASGKSSVGVVIAQAVLLTGYAVFSILLSRQLHDTLPSHIRAGSSSAVGTLAQLTFIPVTFLFGWLSNTYSVFKAAWVVIGVTILAVVIFCLKVLPRKSAFPGSTHDIL